MKTLTKKELNIVEEVVWLAKAANASDPPQYGEVDLLDSKTWERALAPKTVQQRTLRRYIDGLRPKYKVVLQAVMSLGTGLRETEDFPHLLGRFKTSYSDAGKYMCSKDSLADKLINGLKKLDIEPTMKLKA